MEIKLTPEELDTLNELEHGALLLSERYQKAIEKLKQGIPLSESEKLDVEKAEDYLITHK